MARSPTVKDDFELDRFTDDAGRFSCPRCGGLAAPKSSDGRRLKFSKQTTYDMVVFVCANCGMESVFVRRWGWQSSYAVADSGDPIEQFNMHGEVDTTTAWIRRASAPNGRFQKSFPNTGDDLLQFYRAACAVFEASPEAAALMTRICLKTLLTAQGYDKASLTAQLDELYRETNPKKRLASDLRSSVNDLFKFETFRDSDAAQTGLDAPGPVEPGEAEACLSLVEELFVHYYERPAELAAQFAQYDGS